ncbi:hypothetical protein HRbin06_00940 [archaeon HR06]|nr:hypothetical protein HRbin06_00940 [archaeon HR06]
MVTLGIPKPKDTLQASGEQKEIVISGLNSSTIGIKALILSILQFSLSIRFPPPCFPTNFKLKLIIVVKPNISL